MNDFNSKLINDVKLFASNDEDNLYEEKYNFLKFVVNKIDEENYDEFAIVNEEFESLNANVDGYYCDIDSKVYYLYIANFSDTINESSILTENNANIFYEKIINFARMAITNDCLKFSESDTLDLCQQIFEDSKEYEIVLNFVTNYNVPKAYKREEVIRIYGKDVLIKTIDISDLKEKIVKNEIFNDKINCLEKFGQNIDAVLISSNEDLDTYMFYMKGIWLAMLYLEDGARLLEPNCRSYLKRTARVNAGILETVKNDPELFVSYNNGLSGVSCQIECDTIGKNYKIIKSISNFQIVNGGQTTATLAECFKDGYRDELELVRVPVKLSVIKNLSNSSNIIGNISIYSNTQTAIKKSDPPSNLPYYITLKQLSNKCLSINEFGQSYVCYFERTSGEYLTEFRRNNNSKKFSKTYPKDKKFNKLDIALAINCWQQLPHVVSLGREKNFAFFNDIVKRQNDDYDENYFKKVYATLILFKEIDKLAKKLKVSVKRNVVTYTYSLLSYLTDKKIDLLNIWENKKIDDNLRSLILQILPNVHFIITNPPAAYPEPRMWARKDKCWDKVKELKYNVTTIRLSEETDFYPVDPNLIFIDNPENIYNGTIWEKILLWNEVSGFLTSGQKNMLKYAKKYRLEDRLTENKRKLTKKQIEFLKDIYLSVCRNGFKLD